MKKLIILAASFALVASFAMTAAAADWNFYGSSRIATFWNNVEAIGGTSDVDQFSLGQQGNSRIGAKVKVSDELSGRFEYGTGVNTRILYGEWNFGSGSFLVGQTYAPLNMFMSNQVYGSDLGLLSTGGVFSGREPMLQLKFGGFKIALVKNNNTDNISITTPGTPGFVTPVPPFTVTPAVPAVTNTGAVENSFPAIEASYRYGMDNWSVTAAGGYQTYERTIGTTIYDVDSYVVALGGTLSFGSVYTKGNVYMGENSGNLISVDVGNGWASGGYAGINGTNVDDNDVLGYVLVLGAKINDMFSVEAGYSYAETELSSVSVSDEISNYYLNATIVFAPGVFVVPEIGVIDGEEVGQTEETYFGAKWQINF